MKTKPVIAEEEISGSRDVIKITLGLVDRLEKLGTKATALVRNGGEGLLYLYDIKTAVGSSDSEKIWDVWPR